MPTCEHPIVAANPSDPSVNDAPDKERIEPPFSSFSLAYPASTRRGPNDPVWVAGFSKWRILPQPKPGQYSEAKKRKSI
jgi:hypothetical protein